MTDQSDSHDPLHKIISDHIGEIRSIVPLGEGLDNVAFLVNDELVVRQSNDPNSNSRADAIRREAALLAVVARWSPLPVPEIVFAEPESGLLAYPMLPGQSCIDLPRDATPAVIAEPLGELLTAIHGIPFAEVESLVERDNGPLADWLEEAEEGYAQIAGSIPASSRRQIEAFLAEPPPPEPGNVRFCHNDLGAEHILVDPATMKIIGIIDWTDAAITDPVRDLALIFRDFGLVVLERVLAAYGANLTPADHQRLLFHARCKLIEDIAYGVETGSSRYLDAALAHLGWTFG